MHRKSALLLSPFLVTSLMVSCTSESDPEVEIDVRPPTTAPDSRPLPPSTAPAPSAPTVPAPMEIEVNIQSKELHVLRNGTVVETYPVAVGTEEWPTPTGEWTIHEVMWNPRWTPPDEEWAEGEVEREPGDPKNPLGKAQLVYDLPNSIHGTTDTSSLGKAASHGSIRVSNAVATQLARQVMEAGGAARDEAWFKMVQDNPSEEYRVTLPNPVTIRVLSRAGPGTSPR